MFTRGCKILLALCLAASSPWAAPEVTIPEYRVKALYIVRLPDYVYWPASAGVEDKSKPFLVGVLGQSPFEAHLNEVAASHKVQGRILRVEYSPRLVDLLDCQLLFVCESDTYRLAEIFQALKGKAVLTVGDAPDFARQGGMVNLSLQQKRVSIEVNVSALKSAGLEANSHLLKIAKIVGR